MLLRIFRFEWNISIGVQVRGLWEGFTVNGRYGPEYLGGRGGTLGLGHNTPIHTPQRVPQLCHKNIHQFINGYHFVLAVNTDNNVIFSFGRNNEGQLGRGVDRDWNVFHKPCGERHTTVLTSNGQVFGWGCNDEGQLCDFGLAKEVPNCDPFRMTNAKHTSDVGAPGIYQAPEAQTNDYNHLIDIYSLSLIGAQIFRFDTYDIVDGKYD
ncbi:unnamed protein product [Oppiella nova]|uniref:Uncharacterized protein n=1 Tax=Oppiella nova TaxID=334625 RepID=A0A7R9M0M3_9ACAR|nr:unnamed protein product [Oppiella nova]CAG2168788.1 unnamed protein product [Oppiella nova]